MNLKLFISTFVLIFLAELGDKTQLAAMARAATGGGRWTIFAAAASALVVSTLIAVLAGSALTRVVPDRYIKMAAGALFLVFGALILANALKPAQAGTAVSGELPSGPIARAVLLMAAEFEAAAAADYAALADGAADPALKSLLLSLADGERQHLDRVGRAEIDHGSQPLAPAGLPATEALNHDVSAESRDIAEHAIEHELATASFYEELARVSTLPSMKSVFSALASEERIHASRLEQHAALKIES